MEMISKLYMNDLEEQVLMLAHREQTTEVKVAIHVEKTFRKLCSPNPIL